MGFLLLVLEVYESSYLLCRILLLIELFLFALCLLMAAELLLCLLHMIALLLQSYRNTPGPHNTSSVLFHLCKGIEIAPFQ